MFENVGKSVRETGKSVKHQPIFFWGLLSKDIKTSTKGSTFCGATVVVGNLAFFGSDEANIGLGFLDPSSLCHELPKNGRFFGRIDTSALQQISMSNRERYSESMCRDLSRRDQELGRKEIERGIANPNEGKEGYEDLCHELDSVIQQYFPTEFTRFTPPSIDRTQGNLAFIASMFGQQLRESDYFDRSFIAGTAVRYVDNFIDEALWPDLEERIARGDNVKEVEEKFGKFLHAIYAVVTRHEAYMPEEILNLPKTEMQLLLHPDQQTLDENIDEYFFYKSFNLAYMEHLLTMQKSAESIMWSEKEWAKFHLIAAWDVARDIHSWGDKTDFDIFRHIYEHKLDPSKMIDLLWRIIQDNAPKVYEYARSQAADSVDYYELSSLIAEDGLQGIEAQGLMDCFTMIEYLKNIHDANPEDERND